MSLELIIFILLVLATFINNGVQAYIHFEAYPLIAFVGKSEFAAYLTEYERRLTVPLVLPYVVTVLSNLILIFVRPSNVSVIAVIVVLVLNIAVAVVTGAVATPVYTRIKQNGVVPAEMAQLMRINLLRLILSSLASLVIVYMLIVRG